jgi:hypothetical protein
MVISSITGSSISVATRTPISLFLKRLVHVVCWDLSPWIASARILRFLRAYNVIGSMFGSWKPKHQTGFHLL